MTNTWITDSNNHIERLEYELIHRKNVFEQVSKYFTPLYSGHSQSDFYDYNNETDNDE